MNCSLFTADSPDTELPGSSTETEYLHVTTSASVTEHELGGVEEIEATTASSTTEDFVTGVTEAATYPSAITKVPESTASPDIQDITTVGHIEGLDSTEKVEIISEETDHTPFSESVTKPSVVGVTDEIDTTLDLDVTDAFDSSKDLSTDAPLPEEGTETPFKTIDTTDELDITTDESTSGIVPTDATDSAPISELDTSTISYISTDELSTERSTQVTLGHETESSVETDKGITTAKTKSPSSPILGLRDADIVHTATEPSTTGDSVAVKEIEASTDSELSFEDELITSTPSVDEVITESSSLHKDEDSIAVTTTITDILTGKMTESPEEVTITPQVIEDDACIQDGATYGNGSEVNATSSCHEKCSCVSGEIFCISKKCQNEPPLFLKCEKVQSDEDCCPKYLCRKY